MVALSRLQIEDAAVQTLQLLAPRVLTVYGKFDVAGALEFDFENVSGFDLDVVSDGYRSDPKMHFVTDIQNQKIELAESAYTALLADDPVARFAVGHEIAHAMLHNIKGSGRLKFGGTRPGERTSTDKEWHANCFALSLLQPISTFRSAWESAIGASPRVDTVARIFGVPPEAAAIRQDELVKYGWW